MTGRLRHLLTFQSPLRGAVDSYGEENPNQVWGDVFSTRGQITTISARERVSNEKVDHVSTHIIKVRFSKRIASDQRIKYQDRIFQIDSIINVKERDRDLELIVHEVTNTGQPQ